LPKDLGEALAALRANKAFRGNFGESFVDYYARLKEAELARFKAEASSSGAAEVTVWEQNEYFDLF
jgi:glutamine synthetase